MQECNYTDKKKSLISACFYTNNPFIHYQITPVIAKSHGALTKDISISVWRVVNDLKTKKKCSMLWKRKIALS